MKIIELLNKIANGEEVPKKIIAGDSETKYYFDKELKDYINSKTETKLFEDEIGKFLKYYINDEVEIMEEEPRDIEVCGSLFTKSEYDKLSHSEEEKKIPEKLEEYIHTDSLNYNQCNYMFEILTNKYNEIIDYLKSKGDE